MHKFIIATLCLLFLYNHFNAQPKLQLRISLGNGKPFSTDKKLIQTKNEYYPVWDKFHKKGMLNGILNRVVYLPQIGFMLEHKYTKHHTFGLGIMAGRCDLGLELGKIGERSYGFSNSDVTIKKLGFEYTYSLSMLDYTKNKFLKRLYFSGMLGAFMINHRYNDYEEGSDVIFITKDQFGNTIDSTSGEAWLINMHGFMISPGLRVGLLNKKKQERLSVTFLFDIGFTRLWQSNHSFYYNYLKDYVISSMVSRGSQFKIYLSMPITLYKFKKRE